MCLFLLCLARRACGFCPFGNEPLPALGTEAGHVRRCHIQLSQLLVFTQPADGVFRVGDSSRFPLALRAKKDDFT